MQPWLVVWLVVALVSTAALIAVALALGWHVVLLGRAAREAQQALQPTIDETTRLAGRATDRASALNTDRLRPRRRR